MPVPFPRDDDADRTRPGAAEAELIARGIVAAVRPDDGLTPLQDTLIAALVVAMTGHEVAPASLEPITTAEFAQALARRDLAFRTRIVQLMLLGELVLHPLPRVVADRVRDTAAELGVADDMIDVTEAYAAGSLDVAAADFARNGYLSALDAGRLNALHAEALAQPWAALDHEPVLAGRWASLEDLPVGTLGRGVVDFYRDRGFVYPGRPGSAPPLLAQHDWVHVLADYGTTLESELEVFAFMARANDDPRGFALLAMIVSLFETGYLAAGAGLFEASPGHLSTAGTTVRLADAMRRGALLEGSHDFLDTDWFAIADRPVIVVREELRLPPKQLHGVRSPGPWQAGGITEFQLRSARTRADAEGYEYVPWTPDPAR